MSRLESSNTEQLAREIVKRVSDAAIELAFTRYDLGSGEYDAGNYPDVKDGVEAWSAFVENVKEDTLNCLTGDETGCLDEEDLDETNCELIWLTKALTTHATAVRAETWRDIETAPDAQIALFWVEPDFPNDNGFGFLNMKPQIFFGQKGGWSSLLHATHWMPLPAPPALAAAQMEKDRCKYGVCEHDVPWNMECVACGPSEFAAAATTEANDE